MQLQDITKAFNGGGDFARPNLFEVEIPHLGSTFKFKCKAATMPAATIEKIALGYQNRKINIAGDRTYEDWTVTIYNDSSHETRQGIVNWQNSVVGMGNDISGGVPNEYKKAAIVRQLDRNGGITKEHTITGVFPLNVGEVTLDWDTNSEVQTFEATFAIDWWE